MQVCQVSASSSLTFMRRIILYIFLKIYPLCRPSTNQIESSDLDKNRMKHGGLLNKHFCEKKNQISPVT